MQRQFNASNTEALSHNHLYCRKAIGITYDVCVFLQPYLSCMQSACAVFYCHLCRVWLCLISPHYLVNGSTFEKKMLLNIKYVYWFYLQSLSETYLILKRILPDIFIHVCSLHVKYSLFLSDFRKKYIFRTDFGKNTLISRPMKIHPVGA